jgi:hypothetical protein
MKPGGAECPTCKHSFDLDQIEDFLVVSEYRSSSLPGKIQIIVEVSDL